MLLLRGKMKGKAMGTRRKEVSRSVGEKHSLSKFSSAAAIFPVKFSHAGMGGSGLRVKCELLIVKQSCELPGKSHKWAP